MLAITSITAIIVYAYSLSEIFLSTDFNQREPAREL